MANLTQQLVQLSFDGIVFPYTEITREFSLRHHVHEYPHSPGGAPEKLGRKLWDFRIESPFHGDLLPERYRGLWPTNLARLIALFEQEKTGDLILPQVGVPIRAFCTTGKFTLKSSNTSGETVSLTFLEDSERARSIDSIIKIKSQGLAKAQQASRDEIAKLPANEIGLFDAVMRAVSSVLAFKDQFDLYSNLLEAKCLAVIQMLRTIIQTSKVLVDPGQFLLLDLMHEMLVETVKIYKDQQSKGLTTTTYKVEYDTTLSNVSFRLFRTSARAAELMALNAIEDPTNVKRGTVIRFYKDAA
jgi:prophage DNA circulation protein